MNTKQRFKTMQLLNSFCLLFQSVQIEKEALNNKDPIRFSLFETDFDNNVVTKLLLSVFENENIKTPDEVFLNDFEISDEGSGYNLFVTFYFEGSNQVYLFNISFNEEELGECSESPNTFLVY